MTKARVVKGSKVFVLLDLIKRSYKKVLVAAVILCLGYLVGNNWDSIRNLYLSEVNYCSHYYHVMLGVDKALIDTACVTDLGDGYYLVDKCR